MASQWRRYALPMLLLLILLHQSAFAVRVMLADLVYFNLEREVVFWGDGERRPSIEQVRAAQTTLDGAVLRRPGQADYLAMQARLFAWQGLLAVSPAAADEQFKLALAAMHRSLQERPGNPYSWAQYAEYLTTQPGSGVEVADAASKARLLGPGDPNLQTRMQALTRR